MKYLRRHEFPKFHLPRSSVLGETDEWSVAKMVVSQVLESVVDCTKREGKAPLKSTFNMSIALHIQECSQT